MTRGIPGLLTLAILVIAWSGPAIAEPFQAVVNSPHNFLGPSETPAGQHVCFGCHAEGPAYRAAGGATVLSTTTPEETTGPLWQKDAPPFTVESSAPGAKSAPGGSSSVCLGCHDGVLGLEVHQGASPQSKSFDHPYNTTYPRRANGQFRAERPIVSQYRYWSLPDLRDEGFVLPTGPTSDLLIIPTGVEPTDLASLQMVRTSNGIMHCDSCHNPHDNGNAPFLRAPARDLCLICHNR
ncbi:MAG: cytochrome c3 family protein [Nitrospirae bacterium]|nr:cytochrome c3 family protein [Nitrospirota bacterium]